MNKQGLLIHDGPMTSPDFALRPLTRSRAAALFGDESGAATAEYAIATMAFVTEKKHTWLVYASLRSSFFLRRTARRGPIARLRSALSFLRTRYVRLSTPSSYPSRVPVARARSASAWANGRSDASSYFTPSSTSRGP